MFMFDETTIQGKLHYTLYGYGYTLLEHPYCRPYRPLRNHFGSTSVIARHAQRPQNRTAPCIHIDVPVANQDAVGMSPNYMKLLAIGDQYYVDLYSPLPDRLFRQCKHIADSRLAVWANERLVNSYYPTVNNTYNPESK